MDVADKFRKITPDCLICLTDFTPPPKKDDPEGQAKSRRARHMIIPCMHCNLCGDCINLVMDDAKQKKKDAQCPTCREKISSHMLLRVDI